MHDAGLHDGLGWMLFTASGSPVGPSQHRIRMSAAPRLRISVRTLAQNFAPSLVPDPAVPEFQPDSVDVDDRLDEFQWPVLPLGDLIGDDVCVIDYL